MKYVLSLCLCILTAMVTYSITNAKLTKKLNETINFYEAKVEFYKNVSKILINGCEPISEEAYKIIMEDVKGAHGARVFKTYCATCHGANAKGGSGPDISDASLELLKSKVLTGSYPGGYTPKRATRSMPTFKLYDMDLEAIYDYLRNL
jgi:mono/diheme cytochrome c family protein